MPKGFGPLRELQYGLADFNPCQQLRMTCEILHERSVNSEEVQESLSEEDINFEEIQEYTNLAHEYLEHWERQWENGNSDFFSIGRKASEAEQEAVRVESNRLGQQLLRSGLEKNDYFDFDNLLKQRVGHMVDASTFADGGLNERAANTLCWTATRLIFLFKEQGKQERMFVTVSAILFLMMRFGEWLAER